MTRRVLALLLLLPAAHAAAQSYNLPGCQSPMVCTTYSAPSVTFPDGSVQSTAFNSSSNFAPVGVSSAHAVLTYQSGTQAVAVATFTMTPAGKIGIGTTTPSALGDFLVNGTVSTTADFPLALTNQSDSFSGVALRRLGGSTWSVYRYGSGGSDAFGIGIFGSMEAMSIATTGRVTTSNQTISTDLAVGGNVTVQGTSSFGATPTGSTVATNGALTLAPNAALVLKGSTGYGTFPSSVTASLLLATGEGIGSVNPTAKLHVSSYSTTTPGLLIDGVNQTGNAFQVGVSSFGVAANGSVRVGTASGTAITRCAGGTADGLLMYGAAGAEQTICTGGGGTVTTTPLFLP